MGLAMVFDMTDEYTLPHGAVWLAALSSILLNGAFFPKIVPARSGDADRTG
jgi:hypothetical protein